MCWASIKWTPTVIKTKIERKRTDSRDWQEGFRVFWLKKRSSQLLQPSILLRLWCLWPSNHRQIRRGGENSCPQGKTCYSGREAVFFWTRMELTAWWMGISSLWKDSRLAKAPGLGEPHYRLRFSPPKVLDRFGRPEIVSNGKRIRFPAQGRIMGAVRCPPAVWRRKGKKTTLCTSKVSAIQRRKAVTVL